jgi:hypothetical protein
MMPSDDLGPGQASAPGWYPDPAAPGGYLWWTGEQWVNPFSWPPYQPVRRLSQPVVAWPNRPAQHSWLPWLAVACCTALGCATACAILGICLVTGRPVDGGPIALFGAILLTNGVVSWASLVQLDHVRHARSASALLGAGPPPQVVTADPRVGLRAFTPTRLVWVYIVVIGATFGTLIGGSIVSGGLPALIATWWAQVFLAAAVACLLAPLCVVACQLSRRARLMRAA